MKRLGKFTGRIYDDNYDFSNCPECCLMVPDRISENEEEFQKYISEVMTKNRIDCAACFLGCPAACEDYQKRSKT